MKPAGLLLALGFAAAVALGVKHRARKNSSKQPTKVYLLGAGPGAMDLITVRGLRVLQSADVVLSDRLVDPDQLVQACKPGCLIVNVGKDSTKERYSQQDLEKELVEHAQRAAPGSIIVRFKGGDPFVFGLGGSEIEALERHGIAWEYIPGLSSALTLPGMSLHAPLTHKGASNGFTVLSGHKVLNSSEWDELPTVSEPSTTLVVLMCAKNLEKIAQFLTEQKRWSGELPCAVVQNGTTAEERTVRSNLRGIAQACLAADCTQAPLTLIVGKTCALFDKPSVPSLPPPQQQQVWSAHRDPAISDEWWVFGYGSLVWRPDLPYTQVFDGNISGFVRRFYQTSPDHRGTEESPGRVVTLLESNNSNHLVFGKVYQVDPRHRQETEAKLRHREKAGYEEREMMVTLQSGRQIRASVFWAPPSNAHYAEASVTEIARQISISVGPSGPNREYFDRLFEAMEDMQQRWQHDHEGIIIDEHLRELRAHLQDI